MKGSEAIYGEGSLFALVRFQEVSANEHGMKAELGPLGDLGDLQLPSTAVARDQLPATTPAKERRAQLEDVLFRGGR